MRSFIMTGDNASKVYGGLKTETRRIVTPQPPMEYIKKLQDDNGFMLGIHWPEHIRVARKLGKIGDLRRIREPWRIFSWNKFFTYVEIEYKDGVKQWVEIPPEFDFSNGCPTKWRSPQRMFNWAVRSIVEVTAMRLEFLQDITPEGIKKEGFSGDIGTRQGIIEAIYWFTKIWEKINKKRGYGWESNPLVCVYTFEKEES